MTIKKVSFVALSLLLSLSALHAIPSDPTITNSPSSPSSPALGAAGVTLSPSNSKAPVKISVGQTVTVIMPVMTENTFSFSDTLLFGANTVPYTFDFTGTVTDANAKVNTGCANLAKDANDPIVFQRGTLACTYIHFDDDSAATDPSDTDYYTPIVTNEFNFIANVPGTTTLTFSDGRHTYSYPITVVAASDH